jgi:hypothetical protein
MRVTNRKGVAAWLWKNCRYWLALASNWYQEHSRVDWCLKALRKFGPRASANLKG